jgi:dTDP-4-amino-4,6-dideoxygalactose transaminase
MNHFSLSTFTGEEYKFIKLAMEQPNLSGGHTYSIKCEELIQEKFEVHKAYLVPSGTHALEMAALILDIKPGDEVIMPSYTFPSTANAFALRGAKIVFVDVSPATMNIDVDCIERAITKATKAIVPVHYGSVCCDMDRLMTLAFKNNIFVVEDAAQAVNAKYKNKYLGSFGQLGCFSFHESKNIHCGEGGAILINDEKLIEKANVVREKGTNRVQFENNEVEKYSWVDLGSSYLLSELQAAFLYAQLINCDLLTSHRLALWDRYFNNLSDIDNITLAKISPNCQHNGHLFFIKLESESVRRKLIIYLRKKGFLAAFHYVPLHSTKPGNKFGKFIGEDIYTTKDSERILRLPLYNPLTIKQVDIVCELLNKFFT